MTTLIIGGAGYIGSHVAKALAMKGKKTIVFDNLSTGHRSAVQWSDFIHGDTKNIQDLSMVFSSYPIEAVMHLGDLSIVQESHLKPDTYYKNNLTGLLNIMDCMKQNGVKKIIYSSSASVYGNSTHKMLTEETPFNPITPYGKSKMMGEYILKDFFSAYSISSTSLCYFNAAGADLNAEIGEQHEDETHLIPNILSSLKNSKNEFQIYGQDYETRDGTCVRDYIHVMDIAEAHILASIQLETSPGCKKYNLGSEKGYSIFEVINACATVTGIKPHYKIVSRREGDPATLIADSRKARKELQWKPRYSEIHTIIESAWKWHLKLQEV